MTSFERRRQLHRIEQLVWAALTWLPIVCVAETVAWGVVMGVVGPVLTASLIGTRGSKPLWLGDLASRVLASHFLLAPVGLKYRLILVAASLLAALIAEVGGLRRIILINGAVFFVLILAVEASLRIAGVGESDAGYVKLETLRRDFVTAPAVEVDPSISEVDGFRTTTNQPERSGRRLWLYGGSTTYCQQVSDEWTWASQLQTMLGGSAGSTRVENRGRIGALATTLIDDVRRNPQIAAGDVVVFLTGVNEAKAAMTYLSLVDRVAARFPVALALIEQARRSSVLSNLGLDSLGAGTITIQENVLQQTDSEFLRLEDELRVRDVTLIVVLQANIFTLSDWGEYEEALAAEWGIEFGDAVRKIYPEFRRLFGDLDGFVDGSGMFDGVQASVFEDWNHVGRAGNRVIAAFIYSVVPKT